jgi:Na+-translocating ferredoxin:NAD+ oxidoreductase RNF subunit RnfB
MGLGLSKDNDDNAIDESYFDPEVLYWQKTPESGYPFLIDANRSTAIRKLADIESLFETLPGIDCGSCGAPSCHALAEDIINGTAQESDCVFKLRERMSTLFREMAELQEYMPPPFREQGTENRK